MELIKISNPFSELILPVYKIVLLFIFFIIFLFGENGSGLGICLTIFQSFLFNSLLILLTIYFETP